MRLRSGREILDLAGVRAFAFDMDGTLAWSEPVWAAAKAQVSQACGLAIGQDTLKSFEGRSLRAFVREAMGLTDPVEARLAAGLIEGAALANYRTLVKPIPGAAAFVRALKTRGFGLALCTSASRAAIAVSLDILGLQNAFDAVVSAAELPRGKPDKAPYLEAVAQLDETLDAVLAVEDAPAGVQSAHAAGLRVIAVGPECRTFARFAPVLCAERIGEIEILS